MICPRPPNKKDYKIISSCYQPHLAMLPVKKHKSPSGSCSSKSTLSFQGGMAAAHSSPPWKKQTASQSAWPSRFMEEMLLLEYSYKLHVLSVRFRSATAAPETNIKGSHPHIQPPRVNTCLGFQSYQEEELPYDCFWGCR